MRKYAIIVAGGSGSRMGTAIPKQFLLLSGKPILMHTIEAFKNTSPAIEIILVLPRDAQDQWKKLCEVHQFSEKLIIADGGVSRFHSVKNGLDKIGDHESLVAIHDGVRPLVSSGIIQNAYDCADKNGSAIVSTPVKESMRQISGKKSYTIDRSKIRSIQTPQTFKTSLIKEAFSKVDRNKNFTDDASVAEKAGFDVQLVEGSYQNIKITTPEDLLFAEAILAQKKSGN